MKPAKHTLTRDEARQLARELREVKISVRYADIRDWPIWRVRDTQLFLELVNFPRGGKRLSRWSFPRWVDERENLMHCRVCGCADDNACEEDCYWVGPDLCSACQETT
jgi:hypothetical protein